MTGCNVDCWSVKEVKEEFINHYILLVFLSYMWVYHGNNVDDESDKICLFHISAVFLHLGHTLKVSKFFLDILNNFGTIHIIQI